MTSVGYKMEKDKPLMAQTGIVTAPPSDPIRYSRQHYMSLPLSLVEAARIDGASEWKIFSNIMLPLGSNVTITLTIFSFMWRWNDYILPLLVLSDQKKYTIQIAIKNFIGNTGVDWSSILAASVLSILPIVILFMILQKYIVGGVSAGGVKG